MDFDWSSYKATINSNKHGIEFEEAASEFFDPLAITFPDIMHSEDEERLNTFGYSSKQRLLVVTHTEKDERIRIITAREVTRKERKNYEQQ